MRGMGEENLDYGVRFACVQGSAFDGFWKHVLTVLIIIDIVFRYRARMSQTRPEDDYRLFHNSGDTPSLQFLPISVTGVRGYCLCNDVCCWELDMGGRGGAKN
jgi:hypothetical protein